MTSYELTHFKKMVQVWKTKSLLFCVRYDPLIVFQQRNHISIFFHKNDVRWPLSANGLFKQFIPTFEAIHCWRRDMSFLWLFNHLLSWLKSSPLKNKGIMGCLTEKMMRYSANCKYWTLTSTEYKYWDIGIKQKG